MWRLIKNIKEDKTNDNSIYKPLVKTDGILYRHSIGEWKTRENEEIAEGLNKWNKKDRAGDNYW